MKPRAETPFSPQVLAATLTDAHHAELKSEGFEVVLAEELKSLKRSFQQAGGYMFFSLGCFFASFWRFFKVFLQLMVLAGFLLQFVAVCSTVFSCFCSLLCFLADFWGLFVRY